MDLKEFADKYMEAMVEAFQNNNFSALAEIEDVDVIYHTPSLVGHEAHKQSIIESHQYISDIKQEWEYLAGDGNLFALAYKARYISRGKVPGWPSEGEEAGRDAIFLYRLENGKIVEVWQNGIWINVDMETALKASE